MWPKRLETYGAFGRVVALALLLAACGAQSSPLPPPPVATVTQQPFDHSPTPQPITPTARPTQIATASATPAPTLDATQQTWHATAAAIATAESAASTLADEQKATQMAKFLSACDGDPFPAGDVSPNGEWLATSCGYKHDQTLIVQNTEGTQWVLAFKDFLSPETPAGMPGALHPFFWSPDGAYLFFVTSLGYSGGGNDCFPGFGVYGLFRLTLATGTWTTLVPPTHPFPGYEIAFAPTGRRYAVDLDGVLIADLQTGEITRIETSVVLDLRWSPDGTQLAYAVANCDENDEAVQTAAVYLWDALTKQTQLLVSTTEGRKILRPEVWRDNTTLRIIEERPVNVTYAVYVYDTAHLRLVSTGTVTPQP